MSSLATTKPLTQLLGPGTPTRHERSCVCSATTVVDPLTTTRPLTATDPCSVPHAPPETKPTQGNPNKLTPAHPTTPHRTHYLVRWCVDAGPSATRPDTTQHNHTQQNPPDFTHPPVLRYHQRASTAANVGTTTVTCCCVDGVLNKTPNQCTYPLMLLLPSRTRTNPIRHTR